MKYLKMTFLLFLISSKVNCQKLTGNFYADKTWELENGKWSNTLYTYSPPVVLGKDGAFKITGYDFLMDLSENKVSLANMSGYNSAELKSPKHIDDKNQNNMKYINYSGLLYFNSKKVGQSLSISYSIIIKDNKVFGLLIAPDGSKKQYMLRLVSE